MLYVKSHIHLTIIIINILLFLVGNLWAMCFLLLALLVMDKERKKYTDQQRTIFIDNETELSLNDKARQSIYS